MKRITDSIYVVAASALIVLLPILAIAADSFSEPHPGVVASGPGAFSSDVPQALKAAAEKTFAEGKGYFIWLEKPGSMWRIPSSQKTFRISLNYAVKPGVGAEPFATRLALEATTQGGAPASVSWMMPGDAKGAVGDKIGEWKAVIDIKQSYQQFQGKGEATVFLIKKSAMGDENPEPISNVVKLTISFE